MKTMLRFGAPTLHLLLIMTAPAHAGGELEVRWWASDLTSTASVDGAGFEPNLDIPTSLDLGLEADEEIEGRLLLRSRWGLFLRAAYQNVSSAGSVDVDLGVAGLPFDVTAELASELDFEYGRLAIGVMFGKEGGPVQGGVFAEAKGVRGDVGLTASAFGVSAGLNDDFEAGVPAAGAILRVQVNRRLEIFAEASVAVETDEADVTDYEIGARYQLTDNFGVGFGYRTLEIEGTFDDVTVDYELDGAFASAVLRW